MARALVDTGAVVALVNRADRHHAAAVDWFQRFRGQLLSTESVITETAYVLAASPALAQDDELGWAIALSDDGAPAYNHGNAAAFAALGCPAFARTPEQFPALMAAAIEGRDISLWAAGQGIATARGR